MAYSKAKLKTSGNRASLCSRPFWIGKLSDKCLPIRTLLYVNIPGTYSQLHHYEAQISYNSVFHSQIWFYENHKKGRFQKLLILNVSKTINCAVFVPTQIVSCSSLQVPHFNRQMTYKVCTCFASYEMQGHGACARWVVRGGWCVVRGAAEFSLNSNFV
jgi:hypothetical protein